MVNMTETFTKLYGRPPSESEIAAMWKMKREQEGYRKQILKEKTKAPMIRTKPREPKTPTKINEYSYKWPKRASQLAQRINRMLCVQVMIKDIAYIEGVSEGVVMAQIDKWKLPREK